MDRSRFVQIIVAWVDPAWVVLCDAAELGAFDSLETALARAHAVAAEATARDTDCSLLIRDREGVWREEPCGPESGLAA